MPKVLYLLPSLEYSGAARQLTLLAAALPRPHFEVRVCTIGGQGPLAAPLQQAGVTIDLLDWHHVVSLDAVVRLRELLATFRPDVVHAGRLPALRLAAWLCNHRQTRVVASHMLDYRDSGRRPGWLDRRLLRWADRLGASGPYEAECLRRLGVRADRIVPMPPGVDVPDPPPPSGPDPMPDDARVILCVGPLERTKGFRDAVWAFKVVRELDERLRLVLVGEGTQRTALALLAHQLQSQQRVHFVGEQPDVGRWLARAEVLWAPAHVDCGRMPVLEAMASGRPVIAANVPALAELVSDGETGFLIPRGDKAALWRQSRTLLVDADLRRRLGERGRQRVQAEFSLAQLVRRWAALYNSLL